MKTSLKISNVFKSKTFIFLKFYIKTLPIIILEQGILVTKY